MAALVAVVSTVAFTGCNLFNEDDVVNFYFKNLTGDSVEITFETDLNLGSADPITVPANANFDKCYETTFRSHSTVSNIFTGFGIIITNSKTNRSARYEFSCDKNGPAVYVTLNNDGTVSAK